MILIRLLSTSIELFYYISFIRWLNLVYNRIYMSIAVQKYVLLNIVLYCFMMYYYFNNLSVVLCVHLNKAFYHNYRYPHLWLTLRL